MALYLVQHGISLAKEIDPEQGLSGEGISEVQRIADVAGGYGVRVSRIMHSTKKRARQTAEILASVLQPREGVSEVAGLKPMDDPAAFAETIDGAADVMLVGHLPFMAKMTSWLITGDIEKQVFKFQNGGIVCLEEDSERRSWFIKWTLMPNIG